MIRIRNIKIPLAKYKEDEQAVLREVSARMLNCGTDDIRKLRIERKSVDSRDHDNILIVYTVDIKLKDSLTGKNAFTEGEYVKKLKDKDISLKPMRRFDTVSSEGSALKSRVVVIGSGPAGIFAALTLIDYGIKPIIIERGDEADKRLSKVALFHSLGTLDPDSNVQFGEGGAGTFSDGKLNSGIRDPEGIIDFILRTFVRFGGDKSILYEQKPHVGSDLLIDIIKNIREYIVCMGGDYIFNARFDGIFSNGGRLGAIRYTSTKSGESFILDTDYALLSIGNASRDTFRYLNSEGIAMEPKGFAVGLRVIHPQDLINKAMYGKEDILSKVSLLGPSPYKLSFKSSSGRPVYSFCMCPGGYVIDASSEKGRLSVNGMSFSKRDSYYANSAIVAGVNPSDFGEDPLSGIKLQETIEEAAFNKGKGMIPYMALSDFLFDKAPGALDIKPDDLFKGRAGKSDLSGILPYFILDPLKEGLIAFNRRIPGFIGDDAIVAGVETRTSSPLRILRDEHGESVSLKGLYPAGEGAGYAGGIISSARDGILAAQSIIKSLSKND